MGHRTVDDRDGRLAGVRDRPVWQPVPEEMRRRFALRCAITHHRSRREDFDLLGHEVVRIGDELMKEA